ncbi:MAG TPA: hypothetical protein VHI13_11725 [Candidatus Kapabacteria bacterium]|nr:hypothetical protein [Candidatus Kapabacteria bacterium]
MDIGSFGTVPAGANAERTFDIYYSTRIFPGGSDVPTKIAFFEARTTPTDVLYTNLQLPTPNTLPMRVIGVRLESDYLLDPTNSTATTDLTASAMQRTWEAFSVLRWEHERKNVTGIPVFNIVPYEYYRDGSTLGIRQRQDWVFFKLPVAQQIDIKPGARVSFYIDGIASLKYTANATAPSFLPNNGFANQRGHRMTLYLYTKVVQEIR